MFLKTDILWKLNECGISAEWYWQGKKDVLRKKPVPLLPCSQQNLTWSTLGLNLELRGNIKPNFILEHNISTYSYVQNMIFHAMEYLKTSHTITFLLQELNTPPGFSNRLYTLVTKILGLSYSQVISLIKTSQSCQGPGCWDLGDVGSNCCWYGKGTKLNLSLFTFFEHQFIHVYSIHGTQKAELETKNIWVL